MLSIADIDLKYVKHYLRIEDEFEDDDNEILMFIQIAIEHLKNVCGLNDVEFDEANTLIPALLILISEMYEYRSAQINSNSKANPIIERYINANRKFL